MKQKFETQKHNKGRPYEKNNFLYVPNPYEHTITKKLVKQGFVAWPGDKSAITKKVDTELPERRTKSGGYVAYPQQTTVKTGLEMFYPKEAC